MSASAGCRSFSLFDEPSGRAVPLLVFYPSAGPERGTQLGSYTLDVARDGPIAAGMFSLAVISHGNGGSGVLYRSTAMHLARNGFVVAVPDHAGNTRGDNDLAGTAANLENRPRQVRLIIDWRLTRVHSLRIWRPARLPSLAIHWVATPRWQSPERTSA